MFTTVPQANAFLFPKRNLTTTTVKSTLSDSVSSITTSAYALQTSGFHVIWTCFTCPYRRAGDTISLDYCMTDDEGNEKALVETIPAPSPLIEDLVTDRIVLESLVARLTEIMPQALEIINMRLDGITDTAMGHSDISVTMNTYTHLGLEDAKDEMVRLEELNRAREEVENTSGGGPMEKGMFRVV